MGYERPIGWTVDPSVVGTHNLMPVFAGEDGRVKGQRSSDNDSGGMGKQLMHNAEDLAVKAQKLFEDERKDGESSWVNQTPRVRRAYMRRVMNEGKTVPSATSTSATYLLDSSGDLWQMYALTEGEASLWVGPVYLGNSIKADEFVRVALLREFDLADRVHLEATLSQIIARIASSRGRTILDVDVQQNLARLFVNCIDQTVADGVKLTRIELKRPEVTMEDDGLEDSALVDKINEAYRLGARLRELVCSTDSRTAGGDNTIELAFLAGRTGDPEGLRLLKNQVL